MNQAPIRMLFRQNDFENMFKRVACQEETIVDEDEAIGWLKRNTPLKIRKDQLDAQKLKEIQNLDVMQNSNLYSNQGSVNEM